MHPFYEKPKIFQWVVAIILASIGVLVIIAFNKALELHALYILTFFIVIPIFQFCFSPLLTLLGAYNYLSPMLLVFGASDKKYDLHNGTSFDYLSVMRHIPSGRKVQTTILAYFIEGLLAIIQKIEHGDLPPTVNITGTSYFFSERTAEKLGFEITKTNWFLLVNLFFNIIDLCWTYSYSQGKLSFPKIWKAKSIQTTGAELVKRKEYFESMHKKLSTTTS